MACVKMVLEIELQLRVVLELNRLALEDFFDHT